jgi:hypothetical protein
MRQLREGSRRGEGGDDARDIHRRTARRQGSGSLRLVRGQPSGQGGRTTRAPAEGTSNGSSTSVIWVAGGTSRFPQTPSTGPLRGQAAFAAGETMFPRGPPSSAAPPRLMLVSLPAGKASLRRRRRCSPRRFFGNHAPPWARSARLTLVCLPFGKVRLQRH